MITERDLQEAIAECEGQRNPNASTCIKLAAFYTIREHLFPQRDHPMEEYYSYAEPPDAERIGYISDSEFSQAIQDRYPDEILPIMDELMTTLQIVNPALYAGVMRRVAE